MTSSASTCRPRSPPPPRSTCPARTRPRRHQGRGWSLTQTYERDLRNLLSVNLLIVDDFALDTMDPQESRDAHGIITERHRAGSTIRELEPRP